MQCHFGACAALNLNQAPKLIHIKIPLSETRSRSETLATGDAAGYKDYLTELNDHFVLAFSWLSSGTSTPTPT